MNSFSAFILVDFYDTLFLCMPIREETARHYSIWAIVWTDMDMERQPAGQEKSESLLPGSWDQYICLALQQGASPFFIPLPTSRKIKLNKIMQLRLRLWRNRFGRQIEQQLLPRSRSPGCLYASLPASNVYFRGERTRNAIRVVLSWLKLHFAKWCVHIFLRCRAALIVPRLKIFYWMCNAISLFIQSDGRTFGHTPRFQLGHTCMSKLSLSQHCFPIFTLTWPGSFGRLTCPDFWAILARLANLPAKSPRCPIGVNLFPERFITIRLIGSSRWENGSPLTITLRTRSFSSGTSK